MSMNRQDKIMRAALTSVQAIKDHVESTLVAAIRTKKLTVPEEALPALVSLVKASVDDGFQKGYNNLLKQVTKILEEAEGQVAPAPQPKRGKAK